MTAVEPLSAADRVPIDGSTTGMKSTPRSRTWTALTGRMLDVDPEKVIATSSVVASAVKTPVSSAPYLPPAASGPWTGCGSHPPAEIRIPLVQVLCERIWTRYLCPTVRSFSVSVTVCVSVDVSFQYQALPSMKPRAVSETPSFPRLPSKSV